MIADSDIPDTYSPGIFQLVELGLFSSISGFNILIFNGLRRHGGTVPRAPPGEAVSPSAYRYAVICYCPSGAMENQGVTCLAAKRTAHVVDRDKDPQAQNVKLPQEAEPDKDRKDHGMIVLGPEIKNK